MILLTHGIMLAHVFPSQVYKNSEKEIGDFDSELRKAKTYCKVSSDNQAIHDSRIGTYLCML